MVWDVTSFSIGQILTAAMLNKIQSNFSAVMNANSGAPTILSSAMNNNIPKEAIGTAYASIVGSGSTADYILNAYSFLPSMVGTYSFPLAINATTSSVGSADSPGFQTGGYVQLRYRYIMP